MMIEKTDLPLDVESEMQRLDALLEIFCKAMRERLAKKVLEGRTGWDNPENRPKIHLALLAHAAGVKLAAGEEEDIANFAMFLWHHRTHEAQAQTGETS